MDLEGAFLDLEGALLHSLPKSGGTMAPWVPTSQIISRSYIQKKGTFILVRKKARV